MKKDITDDFCQILYEYEITNCHITQNSKQYYNNVLYSTYPVPTYQQQNRFERPRLPIDFNTLPIIVQHHIIAQFH